MNFQPRMIDNYKSKIPVLKYSLDELKKGNTIEKEAAVQVAVFVFSESPELNIPSICQGIGHPDIVSEVEDLCADKVAEKLDSDEGESSTAADDEPLPVGTEIPHLEHSAADQSISDLYLSQYGFANRSKDLAWGTSDEHISRIAYYCVAQYNIRRTRKHEKWLIWDSARWREGDEGDVRNLLSVLSQAIEKDLSNLRFNFKKQKSKVMGILGDRYNCQTDPSRQEKYYTKECDMMQAIKNRLQSMAGMQAIVKRMGDLVMIDSALIDMNECELVFNNLTWNAKTGQTTKPRRESLATRGINMNWSEPTAEGCKNWQEYLKTFCFDEVTIKFLKRSFGYAFLGKGTVKRFWWFRGASNTGKTTLIQLIARTMDTYAQVTKTDLWCMKSGSSPGHTDDLASLKGARLVYADEFRRVSKFDDALIKQATSGGSPMSASHKGEKGFTYRIIFSLFFSSNFDPHLSEEDDAAMKRLTTITFKNEVGKKDESFIDKFLSNPDNKLAIIKWIMEGAQEYLADGLGEEPEAIKESRQEFASNQISVKDQVNQIVCRSPTGNKPLRLHDVLTELTKLQLDTRQKAYFTNKQVSKIITTEFGVESDKSNGHVVFKGLALQTENKRQKYSPEIDYGYDDSDENIRS